MELFLLISLLIVALLLIGIILIQQGKGAEMGASFGSGASNTMFGAPGAGNFLTKSTTILAILFFVIALGISYVKKNTSEEAGIADEAAKLNQAATEATTEPGMSAIPTEAVETINTEIPTEAVETISTEIPTADDAKNAAKDAVKAEADKAADSVEKKVEDIKKDATKAVDSAKTDAEKKLEEAKKKAEEEVKKATGDNN